MSKPLFTNDAVVFGLLVLLLAFIFKTSQSKKPFFKKFYTYIPSLLLCYFLPSLLTSLGVYSPDESKLYFMASRYLLPTSLVFLTLSIDFKEILKLGPKALILFLTGTVGVIIGGPIALKVCSIIMPEVVSTVGADATWRGMSTIAGSWIGGGANQAAMKEIFAPSDALFSAMITVDVIVANIWMAFLLYGAQRADVIDKKIGADSNAIKALIKKMEAYQLQSQKNPSTSDLIMLLGVGFGITAFSHIGADLIAPWINQVAPSLKKFSLTSDFFWLIVISTTLGIALSFTKVRKMEGLGASKIGTVFLYILVATIGMNMDVMAIVANPGLFVLGFIWILVHITLLLVVAKLIKAPFFYVAVGSQANIGGAVSAPVVASAVHPMLAPVGVLLAVLGYGLGTYGAWICGHLMRIVSN